MRNIFLVDYRDPLRRHEIDLETNTVHSYVCSSEREAQDQAVGWALSVSIGFLFRRKLYVAIYIADGDLRVRIGSSIFDGEDSSIKFSRLAIFPFAKIFVIEQHGKILRLLWYWHEDFDSWPDNGDIFTKVEEITSSRDETIWLVSAIWRRSIRVE